MYRNPQQMRKAQGFNNLSDREKEYFFEMMFDINQDILLPIEDYVSAVVEPEPLDNSLIVRLIMVSGKIKEYQSNEIERR